MRMWQSLFKFNVKNGAVKLEAGIVCGKISTEKAK